MTDRYKKNMKMLSAEENARLKDQRVAVVGCGGLGGYCLEMLGRLGIGRLTAIDGDVFEESNLNRQLLSDVESLGKSKAEAAKKRMQLINPLIAVSPVREIITLENGEEALTGHQVVVDAVDNIKSRFILQEVCSRLAIPLVYGAIAGWYGQVTTIYPGDRTLDIIYSQETEKGLEQELGNPSFTPALVAAVQVSEVLKIILGRGELLRRRLLVIDLLYQEYSCIDL